MRLNGFGEGWARRTMTAAGAILALGALLRFYGLGHRQLWLDEIVQLRRFSGGDWIDNVLNLRLEIAAAPLDYVVQDAVMGVAGQGEWAARFHAAFFGCLALLLFFAFCRRLFPPRTALTAMLLLAVSPLHVWYSREGRGYSLFFLLTLASYCALWRALEKGGLGRWALYGLSLTLCLYTNYLGVAVLLAQAVWVAIRLGFGEEGWSRSLRRRLFGFAWAAGSAVLAFFPWLAYTSSSARGDVGSVFLESGLWLRLFKEISGGGYPLSLLLCGLSAVGMVGLWRRGDRVRVGLLLTWLTVPVAAALLLVWWRGYIFAIRQVLICTAPLLAGAALGLTVPGARPDRRRAAALALTVVLSLGAIWLHSGEEEADWKSLVHFLQGLEPDVTVTAPHIEYALSYYLEDLPRRTRPLRPEEIAARLCDRPGSAAVLVSSRYMDLTQSEEAERLRRLTTVVVGENFKGFRAELLACDSRRKAEAND